MLSSRQGEIVLGVILVCAGLGAAVSLARFSPYRSWYYVGSMGVSWTHLGEWLAVTTATFLYLFLGVGAVLIPVGLVRTGMHTLRRGMPETLFWQGLGYVSLAIGMCTVLTELRVAFFAPLLYGSESMYDGGLLGMACDGFLRANFGAMGTYLMSGAFMALAAAFNYDFSVRSRSRELRRRVRRDLPTLPRTRPAQSERLRPRGIGLSPVRPQGVGPRTTVSSSAPAVRETLPPLSLLDQPHGGRTGTEEVARAGQTLEETLQHFGVQVHIEDVKEGPVVIRYEVHLAPGIKVSKLMNLSSDLALALAVPSIRMEIPVSGKPLVGIEVPKKQPSFVYLRALLEEPRFRTGDGTLLFPLGKDLAGETVWVDLTALPHLLIGGSTGSGKSVCMNAIILSLLCRLRPEHTRLLLIDPKKVELVDYSGIPHLLLPPVKDAREANAALEWVVEEMQRRYERFNQVGVRNLAGYNEYQRQQHGEAGTEKPEGSDAAHVLDATLPSLVVVVDELADLMMLAGNRLEKTLCRIAQLGRAAGIHLIVATQRPSVDVITGLIKANFPSRLSFAVASQVDSRTILDATGAERLVGNGDMLYAPVSAAQPIRVQGSYVSSREVKRVVEYLRQQEAPEYVPEMMERSQETEEEAAQRERDEFFREAKELVLRRGEGSTSFLQRRLSIGYNRAARIMEQLEREGVVGPARGSKPREVLIQGQSGEEPGK